MGQRINPGLADTAAFCEHYDIGLDVSANCVVVEARRAERVWYAACVVLATTRADVNGIVRKHLGARKISFAVNGYRRIAYRNGIRRHHAHRPARGLANLA